MWLDLIICPTKLHLTHHLPVIHHCATQTKHLKEISGEKNYLWHTSNGKLSLPEEHKNEKMKAEKDEAPVRPEGAPSSNSVAPGDPEDELDGTSAELIQTEKDSAESNAPSAKRKKKKNDSSSSSSSSSSEDEEEKAAEKEAWSLNQLHRVWLFVFSPPVGLHLVVSTNNKNHLKAKLAELQRLIQQVFGRISHTI